MTEIAVLLPEELAREAGLLALEQMERLLREEIEKRKRNRWAAVERELNEPIVPGGISMEEIADEVRAYRAERRAAR